MQGTCCPATPVTAPSSEANTVRICSSRPASGVAVGYAYTHCTWQERSRGRGRGRGEARGAYKLLALVDSFIYEEDHVLHLPQLPAVLAAPLQQASLISAMARRNKPTKEAGRSLG